MRGLACLLMLLPFAQSFASELKIGIASLDVTPKLDPKKPVYIAGYGPNRKATGVLDPIMARAIVWDDGKQKMAWVSIDVVGLFHDFAVSVRKQLPQYSHVLISSTHNHEGPDTLGLWGPAPVVSGVDPEYMTFLEKSCLDVIKAAEAKSIPVTSEIGSIHIPEWLTDNREPYVKHDELVTLLFKDPKTKRPAGVLIQWNCHPESLESKNTLLSSDYVVSTVKRLEKEYGCPAIYMTGTVGGLMTTFRLKIQDDQGRELKDGEIAKTIRYGEIIAEKAIESLKKSEPIQLTPFAIHTQRILVPMENPLYQAIWGMGVMKRSAYRWTGNPLEKNPVEIKKVSGVSSLITEVGYLKLGSLEVACIPGEIYPELVIDQVQNPVDPGADFPNAPVEPSIYGNLKSKHRMLIGLANDEIGYIIPKRQWDEVAPYCYGRKKNQYGEINSIGPDAAPIICGAFRDLVIKAKAK
jgi:hypothetical protein